MRHICAIDAPYMSHTFKDMGHLWDIYGTYMGHIRDILFVDDASRSILQKTAQALLPPIGTCVHCALNVYSLIHV
jgi:hypothetical protein